MIEANREEAEKCLKIGEAALQAGDLAKAERFVAKAQKLFTTDQVRSGGRVQGDPDSVPLARGRRGHVA